MSETTATGVCVHCGSPLGRYWRPEDGPYCCRGCRAVHELISGGGLDRYYELRPGPQPPAPSLRADSMAWLDRILDDLPAGGLWQLRLDIQGVHCAACVWLLEELLRREPGGVSLRINTTLGTVDLAWDASRGDVRPFLAAIERFGYKLGPPSKDRRRSSRGLLVRMAVCIAAALNVMMFSISYYVGLAPRDGAIYGFFGWLSLALASIAAVVGGQVFFRAALAGLRRRVAHLDLPISLGILLAWGGSTAAFLRHGPEAAYFDSLTAFIALMLVGRWAQENVLERNRNALLADGGADHLVVKRREGERLVAVAATEVARGDELWIAPGDVVPVAGILLRRPAAVSLDWITGESDQVTIAPGEAVPAGAFNASEQGLALAAVEDYAASRLRDLLRAPVTAAPEQRPAWWHRVSTVYVTAVLAVASAGCLLWLPRGAEAALQVTVAVLVVTCPCALGLATPLAAELVHHALRRRGVLVRKADFLEKALRVRKVLLDKTGTLTLGELALTSASAGALARLAATDRALLAAMAARSNHPASRAVARELAAVPAGEAGLCAEELRERPGHGLELVHAGRIWRLGRASFAAPGHADPTATVFAVDGRVLAALELREALKADAVAEVGLLRTSGYELHLLSGDVPARTRAVAAALGLPPERALGGLSPEDKAARVRELDERDTLMVGDGLNDAPSFAAAWCAATPAVDRPVLPGQADFYFLGDGIGAVRRALAAARVLRRAVRINLTFAVVYNLAAVSLALGGLVTPLVAAVLMPLSSVVVVTWTTARLSGRRLHWLD